jgi:hypothetical protein
MKEKDFGYWALYYMGIGVFIAIFGITIVVATINTFHLVVWCGV